MTKKYQLKKWQIVFLCGMGVCYIVIAISLVIEKVRVSKEVFRGAITEINYGERGYVFVKVNDTVRTLGIIERKIKGKVAIGDTVYKIKNDPHYYIIKSNGQPLKYF